MTLTDSKINVKGLNDRIGAGASESSVGTFGVLYIHLSISTQRPLGSFIVSWGLGAQYSTE